MDGFLVGIREAITLADLKLSESSIQVLKLTSQKGDLKAELTEYYAKLNKMNTTGLIRLEEQGTISTPWKFLNPWRSETIKIDTKFPIVSTKPSAATANCEWLNDEKITPGGYSVSRTMKGNLWSGLYGTLSLYTYSHVYYEQEIKLVTQMIQTTKTKLDIVMSDLAGNEAEVQVLQMRLAPHRKFMEISEKLRVFLKAGTLKVSFYNNIKHLYRNSKGTKLLGQYCLAVSGVPLPSPITATNANTV